ncbi:MAG: DNA-directed RNA polymerase subunit alpha [Deltaproteobacteria bacterium]|nr:DNA-directed RNA polymerase subunit alpha [Deltaproteobacteria bacterium]
MHKHWSELIKPETVEADEKSLTATYGKFVGEPFERGFGQTIGNSLRRILLSSLRGAAITSVQLDDALHEFSTIQGATEDVTDIILNLKEVRLKLHDSEREVIRIEAAGPREVLAKDIVTGPQVEILNPEHHIASLSKEGRLNATMVARMGQGYVPAERNREEELPVDTIFMDAVFSPIRKVNFTVTNARVGQRTDYDRLVLEVWTDGSETPEDALAYAARILQDQVSIFINFREGPQPAESDSDGDAALLNENLFRAVEDLEFSVRAQNCLQNANLKYIGELVQKTEQEMLKTKNFGRKSLNEIKELLGELGLELGMKLDHFPSREELESRKQTDQKETA